MKQVIVGDLEDPNRVAQSFMVALYEVTREFARHNRDAAMEALRTARLHVLDRLTQEEPSEQDFDVVEKILNGIEESIVPGPLVN